MQAIVFYYFFFESLDAEHVSKLINNSLNVKIFFVFL